MSRRLVKGTVEWERFVNEDGGREIVSRPDCSVMIRHEWFCDKGKRGTVGTEPCLCVPTYDVMWEGPEGQR